MRKIIVFMLMSSLVFLLACKEKAEIPTPPKQILPTETTLKGVVKDVRVVYENKEGGISYQQKNATYLQLTGYFVNCISKFEIDGKQMYFQVNEHYSGELQHLCASLQEGDIVSVKKKITPPSTSAEYIFSGLNLREAIEY